MAVVPASTSAAPLSAKIPQVTGQKKNGKNWHENKAAFRPLAGQTSYEKRAAKQKQEAEVKKMEKEMKEEKEQERQVCFRLEIKSFNTLRDFITLRELFSDRFVAEESPGNQRQACRKGREGQIRTARGQDARKACRASQAQREEEQDAQVLEQA